MNTLEDGIQDMEGLSIVDTYFAKILLKKIETIPTFSQERALSFIFFQARKGHLCVSIEKSKKEEHGGEFSTQFLDEVKEGLESLPEEIVGDETEGNVKPIIRYANGFYLQKNWIIESQIISELTRLIETDSRDFSSILNKCKDLEKAKKLTSEQRNFFTKFTKHNLIFLLGGPGVGKTYCARYLIELLADVSEDIEILVTAPTGKAVALLEQKISCKKTFSAKTLHALLKINPLQPRCFNKVFLSADILIVDESSMIDAELMALFLSSIKTGAKVIFLGDVNQLPPVEGGSVFADLSEVKKELCVFLHTCHRFSDFSFVKALEKKEYTKFFAEIRSKEIYHNWDFTHAKNAILHKITSLITTHYYKALPEKFQGEIISKFSQFMILSCMRQTDFGVDYLNEYLYQHFAKKFAGKRFCYPIIITKNDYALQLFNGMYGIIIQDNGKEEAYFYMDNTYKVFSKSILSGYEHAFVLSVHKSQGSEYENLFVLIPPGSEKFGKEIIYTAITRARKSIHICAQQETLEKTLEKDARKKSQIGQRLAFRSY